MKFKSIAGRKISKDYKGIEADEQEICSLGRYSGKKKSSGFGKFLRYVVLSTAIVGSSMAVGVVKSEDIRNAYTNTVQSIKSVLGVEKPAEKTLEIKLYDGGK